MSGDDVKIVHFSVHVNSSFDLLNSFIFWSFNGSNDQL